MSCCNRQNRCCRGGCSGTGNGSGRTALENLLSSGTAANRWPVYVSVPAFLWEEDEEENSSSCGSCCCCCRCRG